MSDEVRAGQVWQSKNSGKRMIIVSAGPADDANSTNGRWQWMPEGHNPEHGTWLVHENILVSDYILVKDAP